MVLFVCLTILVCLLVPPPYAAESGSADRTAERPLAAPSPFLTLAPARSNFSDNASSLFRLCIVESSALFPRVRSCDTAGNLMPSDFFRGVKIGIGFAVGASFLFLLLVFGIAMCAGHFQQQMIQELKQQLEEIRPENATDVPDTDSVHYSEFLSQFSSS